MWIFEKLGVPADRFDTARIAFAAPWPTWFLWLCLAAAAVALIWTWLTVRRLRRRSARAAIMILRAAALAAVLAILFEPQLQFCKSVRIKNRVAVAVDASASMSVKDQPGRTSRAEAVADFLRRNDAWFKRLEERFEVAYFTFAKDLAAAKRTSLCETPAADQSPTDLIGALRTLAERYRGSSLQALFLLSDGADNGSSAPAEEKLRMLDEAAEALKAPSFCIAPRTSAGFCDLAVSSVDFEDLAFVRTAWRAVATVKAAGFRGRRIPVSLMQGRSAIATQTFMPQRDVDEARLKFAFMPLETGKMVLTVGAPVYAEEALDVNNTFSIPIRVIRDKTRVLHVCGRPSWDERFLRQSLKQDPNIDLVSLFILRTPANFQGVPSAELSLIPFPENALFVEHLREFDLVIFQNFNYAPYGLSVHLPNIRRFVLEYGGAFVMLGGDLSFSEGLYATSPIADILPVEIAPEKDQIVMGDFSPALTEAGLRHPILSLDPDRAANEKTWKKLPPLSGCNKVLGLKPKALALAVHPALTASSGAMPVIAVMEAGRGRSMAVTTDSTWNWGLPAVGETGASRHYFTFWRNAVRWLIKDPELNLVRIQFDRDTYEPGEEVQATVTVLDHSYKPAADVPVRLRLTGPAAPPLRPDARTNDLGRCELSFRPAETGVYALEATADTPQTDRPAAAEAVLVQHSGPELRDVAVGKDLLARLAGKSGGRLMELPADDFPSGVKIADPYVARILEKEEATLWDNWVCLGLVVGLLSLEWWIRKRSGLP